VLGAAIQSAREYIAGDSAKISTTQIEVIDTALHIADQVRSYPVFMDIVIEKDEKLVLNKDINAVITGDLIIKTGGTLVCMGQYTSIWAYSAKGKQT
jgi:hypothetical protein